MFAQLWNDDQGAVVSAEIVLVLGLLVFGIIPGLVALRNSVIAALGTAGNALTLIAPNFTFSGYEVGDGANTIAEINGFAVNGYNTQLTSAQVAPVTTALSVLSPAP